MHYRNPTAGAAVIVVEDGKLLLVERSGSDSGGWCIPCGHVEWGEDVRASARRELAEETGLEVDLGAVFDVQSNAHDPEHQTVGVWFLGSVVGGQLQAGSDARQARFFPLDSLPDDMAFPADIVVCDKLREAWAAGELPVADGATGRAATRHGARWLPAVAMAVALFALSSVPGWQMPVAVPIWGADKLAHAAVYALFGLAIAWPLDRAIGVRGRIELVLLTVAIGVLYGISDEWHQSFVPNRAPSSADVVADGIGALLGALLYTWRVRPSPTVRSKD